MRVTRTIFDLGQFEDVLVGKDVSFTAITDVQDALSRIGNDSDKLISLINKGMEAEVRDAAYNSAKDWHLFKDETKGAGSELNGMFQGTPASKAGVNALQLTLAKTVFGYSKDLDKEAKAKAKADAYEMIKGNPAIVEGLKKSAALDAEDEA